MERVTNKSRFKQWLVLITALILATLFAVAYLLSKKPAAMIRIVDVTGNTVPGATVRPYALRPKHEGGHHGHYLWTKDRYDVSPEAVVTDRKGVAIVPYPEFVFERVETGEISVSIRHSRYISDNNDIVVSTSPPIGAPWKVRLRYIIDRLRNRAVVTRSDLIVLRQGQILILKSSETPEATSRLYAQTSSKGRLDIDFWDHSQSGILISRKHASGDHAVRLIGSNEENQLMFSDTVDVTVEEGVTNTLSLDLKPGRTVRGKVSDNVPRPVLNGRVVASIVPSGRSYRSKPPRWHAWTTVNKDGSFEIPSLPAGDLEIVALCNGFISVGQGQSSTMNYPQTHVIGTDDLDIVIKMEPTARLEVTVYDENGQLLEGVLVTTSPNVRWGNWASTIFCSDLYNTIDRLKQPYERKNGVSREMPSGFSGISDKSGVAILSNVPANQTRFAVDHPDYVLPKTGGTAGFAPSRDASIILQPGAVTETTVSLEPRNMDPQRHYD